MKIIENQQETIYKIYDEHQDIVNIENMTERLRTELYSEIDTADHLFNTLRRMKNIENKHCFERGLLVGAGETLLSNTMKDKELEKVLSEYQNAIGSNVNRVKHNITGECKDATYKDQVEFLKSEWSKVLEKISYLGLTV